MALRDKTNQRFKEYFEKQSKRNASKEFEISYSEIQRDTGAANSTMKRAIETLEEEGWLQVKPGRNSRYGIFELLRQDPAVEPLASDSTELPTQNQELTPDFKSTPSSYPSSNALPYSTELGISELEHILDGLRRRLRTQEMTIALLQDRVAELEDKLFKR